jgi:uncharacterized protein
MSAKFDPFSNRLSREIRNRLSIAFVHSVERRDPGPFRTAAREILDGALPEGGNDYARDRLVRYEQAFPEVQRMDDTDHMGHLMIIWNAGLYFEVHEYLESLWKEVPRETRMAYKAIIMSAGAYIHLEQGHVDVAQNLAIKAAALLREYRESLAPSASLMMGPALFLEPYLLISLCRLCAAGTLSMLRRSTGA